MSQCIKTCCWARTVGSRNFSSPGKCENPRIAAPTDPVDEKTAKSYVSVRAELAAAEEKPNSISWGLQISSGDRQCIYVLEAGLVRC